ncbi:MAG: ATP-dependent helicase, partial [Bacteroidaceae bacterium]|nr:ATP-dependent helicase [Bacteroidaceae bacterium]
IREEYRKAVPYRSGMKWGLKVGNRMTVPPIYRNIRPPIGKYCAVEKNYSQWGVISIDGSILIEEKYPDVSVEQDGTVWLTSVTGKRTRVKLE